MTRQKKTRRSAKGSGKTRQATFGKRSAVAVYYGFSPTRVKLLDRHTLTELKKMLELDPRRDSDIMQKFDAAINVDEKISLLHNAIEKESHVAEPIMVYFERETPGAKKASGRPVQAGLEIIGSGKSVSEATLIKTAMEILKGEGFENLFVTINSLGDRESLARLTRELTIYYRKHINDLPPPCRQLLKRDVFEVLLYPHEKCLILREDAPKPMNYLTELSREHFREVLEFLERMDIQYEIVSSLVGNRKYTTHVVFEIKSGEFADPKADILARGIRYNGMAKKLGSRKDIAAVGAALAFIPKPAGRNSQVKIKPSKIYFIQLGFEAKLKSLKVIEMLRQSHIPVEQSLSKDKLSSQLAAAEHQKFPHVLIMGQKEAMEGSIIVRAMQNRSQATVPIGSLIDYLKKLAPL